MPLLMSPLATNMIRQVEHAIHATAPQALLFYPTQGRCAFEQSLKRYKIWPRSQVLRLTQISLANLQG